MTIQTQDLNYAELSKNRKRVASGGDENFTTEDWDNKEKFDGRLLIIFKKNLDEPLAAVKYNPSRTTPGLLFHKIKNGLLLQEPLTLTEKANVAGIAMSLVKYGYTSLKTDKLNWTLQILDEIFSIRVKVEQQKDGYYLTKK